MFAQASSAELPARQHARPGTRRARSGGRSSPPSASCPGRRRRRAFRRPSRRLGAVDLDDHRVALAAAGADRRHAEPAAAAAQLVDERQSRMRAPLAPIGWPSAIAPPLTLTLSSSTPSMRIELSATDANASLISNRSMSSTDRPAFSSAASWRWRACGRGRGSRRPPAAWRDDRGQHLAAVRLRPLVARQHERAGAVVHARARCRPCGRRPCRRSRLAASRAPRASVSRRGASSTSTVVSPFFDLIVTGTISSGRRPSSVAWIASSWLAQRELVHVGARHLELLADLVGLGAHAACRVNGLVRPSWIIASSALASPMR